MPGDSRPQRGALLLGRVDASAWLDGPGLPANAWKPESARLEAVRRQLGRVPEGTERWTPTEWQLWLDATPRPFADCAEVDTRHRLSDASNAEVLVSWLTLACESGYLAVLPRIDAVLSRYGRMKYLKPLYRALAARPETKARARMLFEALKARYHPIAQQVVASVLS